MKRLIAFILGLALTLSLAACGNRADVSKNTDVKNDKSSVEQSEKRDGQPFAGFWHAMNTVAEGFSARYALYDNGTFIYGSSQIDVFDREIYKAGTWSVADGELRLEVEARWVVPVGNIEDIIPSDKLIILAEVGLVKVIENPPEIETYSIAQTGKDSEAGRATIAIDSVTFYDFNDQADLFDEFYELPGEAV